jgi:hypothetical protein
MKTLLKFLLILLLATLVACEHHEEIRCYNQITTDSVFILGHPLQNLLMVVEPDTAKICVDFIPKDYTTIKDFWAYSVRLRSKVDVRFEELK